MQFLSRKSDYRFFLISLLKCELNNNGKEAFVIFVVVLSASD